MSIELIYARLNAPTFCFFRNADDETVSAADIQWCRAAIKTRLGDEVMCYLNAPDQIDTQDFVHRLTMGCVREAATRLNARMNAELAELMSGRKVTRPPGPDWPTHSLPTYVRLVVSVLGELGGKVCDRCHGKGWLIVEEHARQCGVCRGSGREPRSQRARANAMHVSLGTFQRHWEAPYEWLMARLCQAQAAARHELLVAMGRIPADPKSESGTGL